MERLAHAQKRRGRSGYWVGSKGEQGDAWDAYLPGNGKNQNRGTRRGLGVH